jgi:hypothetical protein
MFRSGIREMISSNLRGRCAGCNGIMAAARAAAWTRDTATGC